MTLASTESHSKESPTKCIMFTDNNITTALQNGKFMSVWGRDSFQMSVPILVKFLL